MLGCERRMTACFQIVLESRVMAFQLFNNYKHETSKHKQNISEKDGNVGSECKA